MFSPAQPRQSSRSSSEATPAHATLSPGGMHPARWQTVRHASRHDRRVGAGPAGCASRRQLVSQSPFGRSSGAVERLRTSRERDLRRAGDRARQALRPPRARPRIGATHRGGPCLRGLRDELWRPTQSTLARPMHNRWLRSIRPARGAGSPTASRVNPVTESIPCLEQSEIERFCSTAWPTRTPMR